jgi:uncharacterized protein YukE
VPAASGDTGSTERSRSTKRQILSAAGPIALLRHLPPPRSGKRGARRPYTGLTKSPFEPAGFPAQRSRPVSYDGKEVRVSTIGAEMGQLQQLGQSFTRESQTVAQLTAAIGGQVNSTWWKGPAADRFRSSWEGEFAPTLRRLEAALQQASAEVHRRHEALTQAGS